MMDSKPTKPRCEIVFEQSIKSEATKQMYLFYMKKFMHFVEVDNMQQLLEADQKTIQEKVEDYVFYLKPKMNPNSVPTQLQSILLFYDMNDVVLNKVKIRKMFPAKIKKMGFKAYTREDVSKLLANTNRSRTKSIIFVLSSTGMRVGGLTKLKIRDVEQMPNSECKCLRVYTGFPEEYYSFLTPEASRMLDMYLKERSDHGEELNPESPLISKYMNYKKSTINPRHMDNVDVFHTIETIFIHLEKRKRELGGRFEIQTLHGLRKFFNKTLKMRNTANISICEKLMSHSITVRLDNSYLPVEKEELFVEFEKAIPELTIGEEERQLLIIKQLEEEKKEEQNKESENKVLKEELDILRLRVERMEATKEI